MVLEQAIDGKEQAFAASAAATDVLPQEEPERFDALNEAVILFGGAIKVDSSFNPKADDPEWFSSLGRVFASADYVVAPLVATEMARADADVLPAFLDKAYDAGYSLLYTRNAVAARTKASGGAQPVRIGRRLHHQVVPVNDMKIGFVFCAGIDLGDMPAVSAEIQAARADGAEYVFVLSRRPRSEVLAKAQALADNGADFVAFYGVAGARRFRLLGRSDGSANVPFIGSLGMCMQPQGGCDSAFVRVKLLRDYDGHVDASCCYIPTYCCTADEGPKGMVVPLRRVYFQRTPAARLDVVKLQKRRVHTRAIAAALGKTLPLDPRVPDLKNKNGFKPQFSIREICEIIGADPATYTGSFPIDDKVHSVVVRRTEVDKGCVAVIDEVRTITKSRITPEMAIEAGAIAAIATHEIEGLPTIVVDDAAQAYIDVAKAVRRKYNPFTVAITGTVGKTTTTDMIKTVMKYGYNVLDVRGNFNFWGGIGFCVQKLDDSFDAYVQECHGGSKGAAKLASSMVLPNACVITFIGDAHLTQVGNSVQDVLREKLQIADSLQEGGAAFLNCDNEYLREADLPCKVIRYASSPDVGADYWAEDIVDWGDHVEFTIVSPDGRYPALLNISGAYNVANAVGAFAVGRFAGIEPYKLVAGISRFRTSGYRQNTIKFKGMTVTLDCDSTTPDSMRSALVAFSHSRPAPGGRRIAVLGDIAMLGKKSQYWHSYFGDLVADLKLDCLVTFGKRTHWLAETARARGVEVHEFSDRDEFEKCLVALWMPGDTVLFKSSLKGTGNLLPSVQKLIGDL